MATSLFLNLPVKDLSRAVSFFTKLGYTFNAQFTNESATCMIVSENIYVMLLVEKFFQTFTDKKLIDRSTSINALVALSAGSREAVNRFVDTAIAAGAKEHRAPQDHGFMYSRSFEDLDGHVWESFWMDQAHVQK